MSAFDYKQAFSRNLGLVSEEEQEILKASTVAIAGMGGVGGDYLVTLARTGIGGFHVADFDHFELANFNRQYGATLSSLGKEKAKTMAGLVLDINPEIHIKTFPEGITQGNLDDFLSGCQVVIDGIDLFEVDSHRMLINAAVAKGLPVLAAVPFGFGAAMVAFDAKGMSFDDYFAITPDMSPEEKVLQLALGFAPAGFHLKYIDFRHVNLHERRGPSNVAACKLCAGLIGTQALVALLHPEKLKSAPYYTHFDAHLLRCKHGRLSNGNKGFMQRLKGYIARRRIKINS